MDTSNSRANLKSGLIGHGGIMDRLEERLGSLGPDRLEAFLDWISEEQWGSKPLHLVRFKGDKIKSSFAVSSLLLERAREQAKEQGFDYGTSTLLEYVLWDFLGKPADLVEKGPEPASKDAKTKWY